MLDPMTALAFSVYSGKGSHALLLGSGVSRSSGIPTGWEIVLDLIRRIAAVEGKNCEPDPAAWYLETHGKAPDYSELLELAAKTSAERMQLLRGYFEPTEEERETGRKLPTRAHHAVARLVADGYIRVIVTTNFDRLTERALEQAGVIPTVISTTDAILGAGPLAHSRCTIIKLHGDYLDTRLKNTPEEIGRYSRPINRLLGRVFDEYGLIVCGWSADWDLALRAAIERCPSRRYATYWAAYRGVTGAAQQLCQNRGAQIIDGMGADEFFTKLAEKIASLKDMDAQHPLSARMAVATIKRYLADEHARIKLHDLMTGEAGRVADALFSDLDSQRRTPTLKQYEAQLQTLLPLMAAAGYWGRPINRKLWLRCFEQLVTPRSGPFPGLAVSLDYYPAYLALHAYGIAALAGGRPGNLASVLARGIAKAETGEEFALIHRLVMTLRARDLDDAIQQEVPLYKRLNAPSSRYVLSLLREPLREWIPEDGRYEDFFFRFEYWFALAVSDVCQRRYGSFGATMGQYMARSELPKTIDEEIEKSKDNLPYLKAGLFSGSLDRLREAKAGFDKAAQIQWFGARHY